MAFRRAHQVGMSVLAASVAATAVGIAGLGPLGAPGTALAEETSPAKSVVVHLSRFGSDMHAAAMAVSLARSLRAGGTAVTLYLDLEGVRLVDRRVPADFRVQATDESLAQAYDGLVKAGGRVAVCGHCAQAAGLDAASLRDGARLVDGKAAADLIRGAAQVVDY